MFVPSLYAFKKTFVLQYAYVHKGSIFPIMLAFLMSVEIIYRRSRKLTLTIVVSSYPLVFMYRIIFAACVVTKTVFSQFSTLLCFRKFSLNIIFKKAETTIFNYSDSLHKEFFFGSIEDLNTKKTVPILYVNCSNTIYI